MNSSRAGYSFTPHLLYNKDPLPSRHMWMSPGTISKPHRSSKMKELGKVLMLDTFSLFCPQGRISISVVVGFCPRTGCDLVKEEASIWTETKRSCESDQRCSELNPLTPKLCGLRPGLQYLPSECFGSGLHGHLRFARQNHYVNHFQVKVYFPSESSSSRWRTGMKDRPLFLSY